MTWKIFSLLAAFTFTIVLARSAEAQVAAGLIDDFSSPGSFGFIEGGASPNPPMQISALGGDGLPGVLQNISDGAGAGGRWLMRNTAARYTGDYTAAGIESILFDFDNLSADTDSGAIANLRIGFLGDGGFFVSDALVIDNTPGFETANFDLASLNHVSGGTGILSDTLTSVTQFEILSAVNTPTVTGGNFLQGDNLVADFRIDNITAVASAIPEPTTAVIVMLGLTGLATRRRR